MAGIRTKDTAPELVVRRIAHRMGLRFRLHRKDLPGRPDLVPKSRVEFWTQKFAQNVRRDRRNAEALRRLGWRVAVIWECQTADDDAVRQRLAALVRQTGDIRGATGKRRARNHLPVPVPAT